MSLIELIDESVVRIPLEAADKDGAIRELVAVLAAAGKITDEEVVYQAVLERERLGSTGLGDGIAVPHGKTEAVGNLAMAVGVSPKGVEFDSFDGAPARLFFLIVAPPDKSGPHIELLAKIARMAQSASFRRALLEARNVREAVSILRGE